MLPSLAALTLDGALRGARLRQFSMECVGWYALSFLESCLVWGTLLFACHTTGRARWLFRVLFILGLPLALGGQAYFYGQYRAYITRTLAAFAVNMVDSIQGQLSADLGHWFFKQLPFALLAVGLVKGVPRLTPPIRLSARNWGLLATAALCLGLYLPVHVRRQQAATPDTLYLNALGALGKTLLGFGDPTRSVRPRTREPAPLPVVTATPSVPRNVLMVITESVRADAVCHAGDADCVWTPATHALFPERVELPKLRSLSSTTAISVAVLWSGLLPTESDETLHTWPLLFDYARAAGWDTAYWTSQSLLFGNTRLWVKGLGARLQTNATALDPEADVDLGADEAVLADHVSTAVQQLKEPYFAVIHLSNTHFPYFVKRERGAPRGVDPGVDASRFLERYRQAVYQQDAHVARMLRAVRGTEAGKRTVVLFTSDHGEAFQEHGQSGHTLSIFDEEISVPGYLDAPPGTLTQSERDALREYAKQPVFHIDIAPTVLDLMGLIRAPELNPFVARLPGRSWLQPVRDEMAVWPLTNCTPLWSCAFENWGVMRGSLKWIAQTHPEHSQRCYDVSGDSRERTPLPNAACAELLPAFFKYFGRVPE